VGAGITAGVLAASATAGALLGYGLRLGAPARPFNAIGAMLLGSGAQAAHGFSPGTTLLGIALHIGAMLGLGVVYASLTGGARRHVVVWAVILAAGALVLTYFVGRLFGVGLATILSPANVVILGVILAIALPIGMRFALPRLQREPSRDDR
jgi:hypothetical protein